MKCPVCNALNSPEAKFCSTCGAALAPVALCPACGAPALPQARFCYNCGTPLTPTQANPALSRLQKYIPPELLARLQDVHTTPGLDRERRVITMLFCDVKGSTALAETMDPEEWAEIMNGAFEYLIAPVVRYEGTVVQLLGDAILAFFGAPIAHEDDPERAVRAALEILEGIHAYGRKVRQEHGFDFEVRAGLNTGLVLVGEVGSDLRLEYTAMGDAINLAARMEQTAQPGTVQVTENTYRLVAGRVHAAPLGEVEVKGKRKPVKTFRILAMKEGLEAARFSGQKTPLAGRQAELIQLRQALEAVQRGEGGIIFIAGEAGMGKSRLVKELRQTWEQQPPPGAQLQWGEWQNASFTARQPYEQFRHHIQVEFGIGETDLQEEIYAKLDQALENIPALLKQRVRYAYAQLLGVPPAREADGPGQDAQQLEGEGLKRELFEVMFELFQAWYSNSPAVLVFEDLHWLDPSSAELITHLFQLVEKLPFLFLCLYRPDDQGPSFQIRSVVEHQHASRYQEIRLEPLSDVESSMLLDHLLPGNDFSPQLRQQILEKCAGNPLYIEELVQGWVENGVVRQKAGRWLWQASHNLQAISLPDSLHALFQARFDRLEEGSRHTLQLAAVIGRTFYYRVLAGIADPGLAVDQKLETLRQSELVLEHRHEPELEYIFRLPLTQEAAYASILLKRRREYHRRVAETMESLFADRLEDQSALLAHHFGLAGDARAARYAKLAGERAARLYANREAVSFYSLALDFARELPAEEQIAIYQGRAEVQYYLGQLKEAVEDAETALGLARESGFEAIACHVLAYLAWLLWSRGEGERALALAQEAEAGAQALGDPALALRAEVILGTVEQNNGQVLNAHKRMRRAARVARVQNDHSQTATCFYYLAMQANFMAHFGRAVVWAWKAHQLSARLGDLRMAASSLFYASLAEGGRGNYDFALDALQTGRQLAEQVSPLLLTRLPNQLAWLFAELGDWQAAYETDLAGMSPARSLPGFREIEISTLINLVLDCIALGRMDEAQTYLREAQKDVGRPEFGSHNWRWATRLADARARLFLALGHWDEAALPVTELMALAGKTHARKYLGRGRVLAARILLAQGEGTAAESELLSARQQADEMCYFPLQIEARLLLVHSYRERGEEEQGRLAWEEAHQLADRLDRQLQHPDLRRCFSNGLARQVREAAA